MMTLAGLTALVSLAAAQPDDAARLERARQVVAYFEAMSAPKPFVATRAGAALAERKAFLREKLLECCGLSPLPERVPLDVHATQRLDHPWCTVRRVYYQIWPDVYASGLLYVPKGIRELPMPAVLSPHGHWQYGNAHPVVQTRCLNFARLGYVVFSPPQDHYEDLNLGISHQTIMVWSNMRALDYLESLSENFRGPDVDRNRIGCCGFSGGGLQTQMLAALDDRVKVATIGGLTCEFREIIFPHAIHCVCNHFPGIMRYTDHPEISALALPRPLQFLTMDDWTKHFRDASFPSIRALYEANGVAADRVACEYEATDHSYTKVKREATYRWFERWLHGNVATAAGTAGELEPAEVKTFEPEKLLALSIEKLGTKPEFARVSDYYRSRLPKPDPARLRAALPELLGEAAKLPRETGASLRVVSSRIEGGVRIDRVEIPSEGPLWIPAIALRPADPAGKLPLEVVLDAAGKDKAFGDGALERARAGSLVVLPDIRFTGELSYAALAPGVGPQLMRFKPGLMLQPPGDPAGRAAAHKNGWERNSIVWGRPLLGMAATDLGAVIDAYEGEAAAVTVIARGSAHLAVAALFAAALDKRIGAVEGDLADQRFKDRNFIVPFILRYGDVPELVSLLADRKLALKNVPDPAAPGPASRTQ